MAARSIATLSLEVAMGLLDVLGGMRNGPRGMGGGSGMSPIAMGVLGLLAYKAYKGFAANRSAAASGGPNPPGSSGGLGDLFGGGGSGGLLGGSGLAGVLGGGLADLVKQFQTAGRGDVADSWVSTGPNKAIGPNDLSNILSEEQTSFLMERTGMTREELLAGLSEKLPEAVDQLTPGGRLPKDKEIAGLI